MVEEHKYWQPERSKEDVLQGLSSDTKQGRGSTGVEFFYQKYDEFKTPSKEQCDDFLGWRKSQKNVGKVEKH